MRFALDSSTVSRLGTATPGDPIYRHIGRHQGALVLPAPAWHELLFGYERLPDGRRKDQIWDLLAEARGLPQLPYDTAAATWHARERARLAQQGRTPPFVDGQIAAVAAVNSLVLVTANLADFGPFSVECVDWS